ncbi:MAG: RNA methyltransferase [Bacteroidetes bacterium]|uniref:RNA methyltransferase n=1 Tax=Candidatus Cryptobacteroides faecigallinarum TaxID=2840763 RepID=A0A9D9IN36_9BACT|nr:RNA methyltransferase [Candidatus Cryptobacteroides faecigallinarum]
MKPSLSNNEIKRIKSLSQKKFRDEYSLFVAEGEKIVDEALRSGYEIEAVYRREEIGEDRMSRISQLSSPSPVLAVIRKPAQEQIQIPSKGLFLGLDSLRDPGNLGTVIRIADWFGINAIFASYDTVDVFNPKVVQSTMGAIFRVRFHYCDLESVCKGFMEAGGRVYGTFLDGKDIYSCNLETGLDCPVMAVMGNESEGISDRISKIVSDRLFIPPYPADEPGSESLNVSVATAVTVAEFRRRIR